MPGADNAPGCSFTRLADNSRTPRGSGFVESEGEVVTRLALAYHACFFPFFYFYFL